MTQFDTALLIGNDFQQGQEAAEPILNPRTGAFILNLPEASTAQVDAAVGAGAGAATTGGAAAVVDRGLVKAHIGAAGHEGERCDEGGQQAGHHGQERKGLRGFHGKLL